MISIETDKLYLTKEPGKECSFSELGGRDGGEGGDVAGGGEGWRTCCF